MWAGTITLRFVDHIIGVRVDADWALGELTATLAAFIAHDVTHCRRADGPTREIPASISVVVDPPSNGRGPRTLPHLRIGTTVVARSRQPGDVLSTLLDVLGSLHALSDDPRHDEPWWVDMRTFVRADRAVLVLAARPQLLADRVLARSGIDEIATWSVRVHPDGSVEVPPPLGVDETRPARFQLAGILMQRQPDDGVGALVAELATRSTAPGWFTTVADLADAGRVFARSDLRDLRDQLVQLLEGTGEHHDTIDALSSDGGLGE